MPNYDEKTGIHYGVIHRGSVLQAWSDDSEPVYDRKPDNMENEDYEFNVIGWKYEKEGYIATQTQDDPNIMVIKSPYYTMAKKCSPCYPNAGDLDNATAIGYVLKTYCFGHDWFENGVAGYTVYSVKTGKVVHSKEVRK